MKTLKVTVFTLYFLLCGCATPNPPPDLSQMAQEIGEHLGIRPNCLYLPKLRPLPDGLYVAYENTIFIKDPNNTSLMAHELTHWLLRGKYPPEIQDVIAQDVARWWLNRKENK